jgi:hypothetical protein
MEKLARRFAIITLTMTVFALMTTALVTHPDRRAASDQTAYCTLAGSNVCKTRI